MTLINLSKYDFITNILADRYGLTSSMHLVHYLAQIHHESAGLTRLKESLNYTPQGLLDTFGKRITKAQANALGRVTGRPAKQQEIANIVYGGHWGRTNLGNIYPDDGWRYRGRGPIQCTGRINYYRFGNHIGIDLLTNPELMEDIYLGLQFAGWYWKDKGLTKYSGVHWNTLISGTDNAGRIITRIINGGTHGIHERYTLFLNYHQKIIINGL